MARFTPQSSTQTAAVPTNKRYPFTNPYGCVEEQYVYVNMESVETLKKGMTTIKDIALIIDISGSMFPHYDNGSVQRMATQIVDALAWADDDGIDLYFFSKGLVYETNVADAAGVDEAIKQALKAPNALKGTLPTAAFRKFTDQCKAKHRGGVVLFLTDGIMDDRGAELQQFYRDILHTQFVTRDNFYAYAVEFGRSAFGALEVLNGLYGPEQGPEDLFDLESASNLDHISEVLSQVGGMAAVGSDVIMTAKVDNGALIDMVNTDLIEGGMSSVTGPINQIMSFRILANNRPFTLTVEVPGFDPLITHVTPNGLTADLKVQ